MIVVELQNDLVAVAEAGGLPGALARAVQRGNVLANVRSVLDACRTAGVPIVYATRERDPSAPRPPLPLYRRAPGSSFLEPGSWGAQVADEVAPREGDVVLSRTTSL